MLTNVLRFRRHIYYKILFALKNHFIHSLIEKVGRVQNAGDRKIKDTAFQELQVKGDSWVSQGSFAVLYSERG